MTDQTPAPVPAEPAVAEDAPNSNSEAAGYRVKLRDAEARLEAAETRVTGLLRKEIETHAAKTLSVGADLFDLSGTEVSVYLAEDGSVDLDAIDEAVRALLATRPGLSNAPLPWPDVGGGHRETAEHKPTMQDALRHGRR